MSLLRVTAAGFALLSVCCGSDDGFDFGGRDGGADAPRDASSSGGSSGNTGAHGTAGSGGTAHGDGSAGGSGAPGPVDASDDGSCGALCEIVCPTPGDLVRYAAVDPSGRATLLNETRGGGYVCDLVSATGNCMTDLIGKERTLTEVSLRVTTCRGAKFGTLAWEEAGEKCAYECDVAPRR